DDLAEPAEVARVIVRHLDQVHPIDAHGPAMGKEVLRREPPRLHVLGSPAGAEQVVERVVGPDVNVCVDEMHGGLPWRLSVCRRRMSTIPKCANLQLAQTSPINDKPRRRLGSRSPGDTITPWMPPNRFCRNSR